MLGDYISSHDLDWLDKSLYMGIDAGCGYVEVTPSCAFYHQGMAIVQGLDGTGFYSFIVFDAKKGFTKEFKRNHLLLWARIPDGNGYPKKVSFWNEIVESEHGR